MRLVSTIVTVFLLGSSVRAAPTNSSSPTADRSGADDDPLEVSETGHSIRRRLWRRLLKQVSSMGQGAYGLGGYGLGGGYGPGGYGLGGYGPGGYGLGGYGLNFLSHIANVQSHHNAAHCCGPHRGPTAYGGVGAGVGAGYGNNVLHYPIHTIGDVSHGGYYGHHVDYPVNHGHGSLGSSGPGLWDSGPWGLFGNYGLGGPDGLHFETTWL